MKNTAIYVLLMSALSLFAQTPAPPPAPKADPPALSTSDRKALTDIATHEQELQKEFAADESLKAQIIHEWEAAHPGWKINTQTYAVEKAKETK